VTVTSTENDPQPGDNTATVSATASDFTVDINPKNQTVPAAGQTAPYAVSLAPVPFFGTAISLSVSGLPTGATSAFTTTSVTLNAGPSTSTLNIATTARPIVTASASPHHGPLYALLIFTPGMAMLGFSARARNRRILGLLALCLLFALILLQPA